MKKLRSLIIYTVSHFIVDFICFYMLFMVFKKSVNDEGTLALGFLLYNVLAFGLQPLLGVICDRIRNLPISSIGCLLIAVGVWFISSPWLALILCNIGNACFHVGGGIDSLVNSEGRIARSGVFVSTGALGVGLGAIAGENLWFGTGILATIMPVALIGLAGLAILFLCPDIPKADYNANKLKTSNKNTSTWLVLVLCAVSIIIRSFISSSIPLEWAKSTDVLLLMLMPYIAAFAGKFLGGFLADRYGARLTGVLSLLLSAIVLGLFSDNALLCTIGLTLLNIPMSITLCGIVSKMPDKPGLAFGLSSFALLIGVVPTYFILISGGDLYQIAMAILLIGAAFCIRYSISDKKFKSASKPSEDSLPIAEVKAEDDAQSHSVDN